jgi:hypothetical protein
MFTRIGSARSVSLKKTEMLSRIPRNSTLTGGPHAPGKQSKLKKEMYSSILNTPGPKHKETTSIWVVTPSSLVGVRQRFRGTYYRHDENHLLGYDDV